MDAWDLPVPPDAPELKDVLDLQVQSDLWDLPALLVFLAQLVCPAAEDLPVDLAAQDLKAVPDVLVCQVPLDPLDPPDPRGLQLPHHAPLLNLVVLPPTAASKVIVR